MRIFLIAMFCVLTACTSPDDITNVEKVEQTWATSPISRCMNLGNALDAPRWEGEWGYKIRRDDLVRLKAAGFDTVRYPIRWSTRTSETPPYAVDPDFFERIDEVIGWGGEAGLNVIINVHHYYQLNRDPDGHEARLERIWDQIAARYAHMPDFLIFEIVNEPHAAMTVERTDSLNRRVLNRIRQDNPDRWVILGTASWGALNGLTESNPPYDPRAILTYHEYMPFSFTHQGAYWVTPTKPMGVDWGSREEKRSMAADFDRAMRVQAEHNMPVFVGEFGVYEGVPESQRARWIKTLRQGLEARDIGWCHWDFATTLKAYDPNVERWLPQIKNALLGD